MPWTEEPGGLESMGSQRVGHNWAHPSPNFTTHTVDTLSKLLHLPTAKVYHVQSGGNKACHAVATAKMNLD